VTRDTTLPPSHAPAKALTLRSVIIGLVSTALIDLWLHYAELAVGGVRGHTALSNTSIPFGTFDVVFVLMGVTVLARRILPSLALQRGELLVIYSMCAVSTVLSSSGGLHMLLPLVTAVSFFATRENRWGELIQPYVPKWMAEADKHALNGFYNGNSVLILSEWKQVLITWVGFISVFAFATLCISVIIRRLWIDGEKLPFPTTALPLQLTQDDAPLFRSHLFWYGLALAGGIQILNTLSLNIPSIPRLNMRSLYIEQFQLGKPWDALGSVGLGVFPFAIGIGYLLPADVAFSCWFFFVLSKAQAVWGSASGWSSGAAGAQSAFPWASQQSSGAFLGLALAMIWMSRRYFGRVVQTALGRGPEDMRQECTSYRWALTGFAVSFAVLVAFCMYGGVRFWIAVGFLTLTFLYLIAATRARAETGSPWPVGPELDAYRVMMMVGGTRIFTPADLTVLTYVRAATAGQDFRGACMPHQLDTLKMADEAKLSTGRMVVALMLAVTLGLAVSAIVALGVFTSLGGLAKLDSWRSLNGQRSFDQVQAWLIAPAGPDRQGSLAMLAGMLMTFALMACRTHWVGWPFHPVGYAMANSPMMSYTWLSMLVAWLVKLVMVKTGGMKLYRKSLPFFFGLIAGDALGGGLTTLAAVLFGTWAYPANW